MISSLKWVAEEQRLREGMPAKGLGLSLQRSCRTEEDISAAVIQLAEEGGWLCLPGLQWPVPCKLDT